MSPIQTKNQVSAGGVAFRSLDSVIEVALISVGEENHWQLPKGQVGKDETLEQAALREVREEAGVSTELIRLIDKIDYWFYVGPTGNRLRIHKFVYFYLMRYESGDPTLHDHEVNEARWVEINQAEGMLNFESEKAILIQAHKMIDERGL
jgi:8-oxo-dGTP diphosphatase